MKKLIEQRLYSPTVVLPMVELMELMVSLDFNLGQVGAVMATRGARAALHRSRGLLGHRQTSAAAAV
ncbi:hypothetical protein [Trinickia soli]|uniref:Uncharacterized protein n=1 Tax=Trinickia soli TaxID=380675 RepID=A0A2N7VIJ3_9BURK|nr:hypothetical protein [Trinickia soli]KAA0091085.1 hypothetical protein CIW54_02630 [Paraburkholderia sp. T12-10]PMS16974.1 hypothetical protein C0Z19_25220 [Trinickia soli]CAB3644925.1 hypothetical protein LMG24076_00544 [Trinickia soli]